MRAIGSGIVVISFVLLVCNGAPTKEGLTVEYERDTARDFRVKQLPGLVSLILALATTPPANPVMPFAKTTLDPPEMDDYHRMLMAGLHAPPPMYNDLQGPRQPMSIHNNPIALNMFALPPDGTLASPPGAIPSVLLVKDLLTRVIFPNGVPLPESWGQLSESSNPVEKAQALLYKEFGTKTKPQTNQQETQLSESKPQPGETKSQESETKTQPIETKSQENETKSQPIQTKAQESETKTQPIQTKSQASETKSQPIDTKTAVSDMKPQQPQAETAQPQQKDGGQ